MTLLTLSLKIEMFGTFLGEESEEINEIAAQLPEKQAYAGQNFLLLE